jgi:hypothetical protein
MEQMPRASGAKPKDEDDALQDPIELMPRASSAKPEAKSNTTRTTNTTEEIIEAEIEKAKGLEISELRIKLIAKGIEVSDYLEKQEMIWAYAKAVARDSKSEKVHEEDFHDRIYNINDLVWYNRVDGTRSRALVVEGYAGDRPSYDIRILCSGVSKTTTGKWLTLIRSSEISRPAIREPNLFESLLLKVYETVSWPTLTVGLLAIMWMWPDGSSISHNESPGPKSHERDEIYYDHYYSYRRWYWSPFYYGYWYWNWWGIVGGLGSVILVGLFTHKLGTNNGSRKFNWNRAWNAVLQMDFWQLIRLVAIFEGALYFLGGIAAGGRRRR